MIGNKELLCGSGRAAGKIEKPVLTSKYDPGSRFDILSITGSDFTVIGGEDEFASADWKICADMEGKIILKQMNVSYTELSNTVVHQSYGNYPKYYFFIRYHGKKLPPSEWSDAHYAAYWHDPNLA